MILHCDRILTELCSLGNGAANDFLARDRRFWRAQGVHILRELGCEYQRHHIGRLICAQELPAGETVLHLNSASNLRYFLRLQVLFSPIASVSACENSAGTA